MSTQRSSSGVRDLRAMFENQNGSATLDKERGRSPTGAVVTATNSTADSTPNSNGATRKIMASFVPVGAEQANPAGLSRTDSVGSIKEEEEMEAGNHLASRDINSSDPFVSTSSGGGIGTLKLSGGNGAGTTSQQMTVPTVEAQTEHTEKPVSAVVDEEATTMQPSDMTSAAAISGGEALPSGSAAKGTVSKTAGATNGSAAKTTKSKGPRISEVTKRTTNASQPSQKPTLPAANSKSAASTTKPRLSTLQQTTAAARGHAVKSTPQQKSAAGTSTTPPKRSPTQPVSLPSHLTAPTASSAAKHEATQPTTKATSRPIELSSHLMAPTTASAAKHDPAAETTSTKAPSKAVPVQKRDRASLAPATNGKAARSGSSGRSSLASADVNRQRTSASSTEKRAGGDFLSRMARPTAASSSKTQDKTDAVKSPPRAAAAAPAAKPKVNGGSAATVKPKPIAGSTAQAKPVENSRAATKSVPQTDGAGALATPSTPKRPDEVAITKEVDVVAKPQTPQDKVTFPQTTASASSAEEDSLVMVGGALMGRLLSTPNLDLGTIR